jgi:hypothetical protein
MKRSGRDEPIWIVTHICMETTQGISLHSYLYLKLAKMPCFSYYFLFFFFNKIRELEGKIGSARRWRSGRGGLNNVYTCKQMQKW